MAKETDYVVTARFLVTTPDDASMSPDDRYQYVINEFYDKLEYIPTPIYLLQVTEVEGN